MQYVFCFLLVLNIYPSPLIGSKDWHRGTRLLPDHCWTIMSVVDVGCGVRNRTSVGSVNWELVENVFWRKERRGGKQKNRMKKSLSSAYEKKALKMIHFTRTKDLTPNMAKPTLIKSIDIHYKTPRPLWDALLEPSNGADCLQIPAGSVWKTKPVFTSTSLTSYNKQNNVFLMDGQSRLPFPLPALVRSDWPAVGFPGPQLAVSRWWMGKVGGGVASYPSPLGCPVDWQAHCGIWPVLTYCSAHWHSHREPPPLENAHFSTLTLACFTRLTGRSGHGAVHGGAGECTNTSRHNVTGKDLIVLCSTVSM